jgi:hypothetical protein
MSMQLQDIPRATVRTYLQVTRLPLTAIEAVLQKNGQDDWPPALAFESFGAGVKEIVGTVLSDDELVQEGRLTRAKVAQLRKAADLEAVAEQRKAEADAQFEQRREADEQRREQVERQADQREAALERAKADEKRAVENKAAQKADAARAAEAATQKALTKQERSTRSTRVQTEREVLADERRAAKAKGEVLSVDDELEATKAIRKNA